MHEGNGEGSIIKVKEKAMLMNSRKAGEMTKCSDSSEGKLEFDAVVKVP